VLIVCAFISLSLSHVESVRVPRLYCWYLHHCLQLELNKAVMSESIKTFLGGVPDKNQYMHSAGNMHGFSTESSAEAYHHSNEPIRKQHLYGQYIFECLLTVALIFVGVLCSNRQFVSAQVLAGSGLICRGRGTTKTGTWPTTARQKSPLMYRCVPYWHMCTFVCSVCVRRRTWACVCVCVCAWARARRGACAYVAWRCVRVRVRSRVLARGGFYHTVL
jgi:hypothetical protein